MGYLDSPFQLHVEYRGKGGKKVQQNFAQGFLVTTSEGFISATPLLMVPTWSNWKSG
ncbi:hypothetical protein WJ542_20695 [Paraburkholderia sp. B3]|uniref:hypothetical protein n=1 Tax=Paraburkholderia sp. B3 TaxID=3134791 RepID=UPI003982305A